jgi:cyclopropane fatty-acyl-phospholipid synthase-like methyltransferase
MTQDASGDARQFSPSTARNRDPILGVLRRVLPPGARVLEIASGTGEHAMHMARAMPEISWQPSDPDAAARASIDAWRAQEGLANVAPPLPIDVRAQDWNVVPPFDAVVAINMIHIAPWAATPALFEGAARLVGAGGIVLLYGPYKRGGEHTAPSNAAFETWLKERDPRFGVRDLGDVAREAERRGFMLREVVEMPANNLSLVFAAA